ncbi:MAG TPA: serine/threonine-protein kinase [Kofleriaceae bacterium]|nr:serine/threonine-protein kinase [Kofleriaceae bacterium]
MQLVKQRATCPSCRAVFQRAQQCCPMDGARLQPLPQDPLVGSLLGMRYQVLSVLGDGGMARSYRVHDTRTDEPFAAQVMYGDYAAIPQHRARFARAASISAGLGHPNVVATVDAAVDGTPLPYMVTELVEGPLLSQIIAAEAPLGARRVLRLLRQLASALEHVHERGVIHRGLSPESVVVVARRDAEIARIFDFGIALRPEAAEHRLTRAEKIVGTPAYMAPEQANGGDSDARSDLYNLGLVLYEMLSGRHPFDGTALVMATLHGAADVPPIHVRVPGLTVDPMLEAVAVRLMQARPADRFVSASALLERLEVLSGHR